MIRLCLRLLIVINNTKYHFLSSYRTPDLTDVIKLPVCKSELNSASENVSAFNKNVHRISL